MPAPDRLREPRKLRARARRCPRWIDVRGGQADERGRAPSHCARKAAVPPCRTPVYPPFPVPTLGKMARDGKMAQGVTRELEFERAKSGCAAAVAGPAFER